MYVFAKRILEVQVCVHVYKCDENTSFDLLSFYLFFIII